MWSLCIAGSCCIYGRDRTGEQATGCMHAACTPTIEAAAPLSGRAGGRLNEGKPQYGRKEERKDKARGRQEIRKCKREANAEAAATPPPLRHAVGLLACSSSFFGLVRLACLLKPAVTRERDRPSLVRPHSSPRDEEKRGNRQGCLPPPPPRHSLGWKPNTNPEGKRGPGSHCTNYFARNPIIQKEKQNWPGDDAKRTGRHKDQPRGDRNGKRSAGPLPSCFLPAFLSFLPQSGRQTVIDACIHAPPSGHITKHCLTLPPVLPSSTSQPYTPPPLTATVVSSPAEPPAACVQASIRASLTNFFYLA